MKPISFTLSHPYLILMAIFNCALLLHIGSGGWGFQKTTAFIIICIGLQFINYRLWWTTILSIIAFFCVYADKFPRLANHANIEIFIGLLLIGALLLKKFNISSRLLSSDTIPVIFRCTLITVYFIAGFHKLNSGFFSLSGTCSVHVNNSLHQLIFGESFELPDALIRIFQTTTIAIEMIVPFGLLFKSTRKLTSWTLVIFHFYLSLCGFSNFSALAGFLIAGSILNFSQVANKRHLINPLRIYLAFSVISCISSYFLSRFEIFTDFNAIRFYNGILFNIGWCVLFVNIIKKMSVARNSNCSPVVPIVVTTSVMLWGLQCYIGLSSAGNLSMFSNLITEKSRSNHFIINTNATKIFDFEENYVSILEIDKGLKWEKHRPLVGYDLPLTEFKVQAENWVLNNTEKLSCKLKHKNDTIIISDLRNSDFSKPKWWYKYILYRRIPTEVTNECMW